MKKSTKIILIVIFLSLILNLLVLASPFLLLFSHFWFTPNPAEPKIQYAEFPYELVYTVDGEKFTINDVYVCEYTGTSLYFGDAEKHLTWKGYVKGTGDKYPILYEDDERIVYCVIGDPEYYMNDPYEEIQIFPCDPYLFSNTKTSNYIPPLSSNQLMDKYNIEIKSWKFSDRIENEYKVDLFKNAFPYIVLIFTIAFVITVFILIVFFAVKKRHVKRYSLSSNK